MTDASNMTDEEKQAVRRMLLQANVEVWAEAMIAAAIEAGCSPLH